MIAYYCVMRSIVLGNVKDGFTKKRNFHINISVRKSFFPVEIVN